MSQEDVHELTNQEWIVDVSQPVKLRYYVKPNTDYRVTVRSLGKIGKLQCLVNRIPYDLNLVKKKSFRFATEKSEVVLNLSSPNLTLVGLLIE